MGTRISPSNASGSIISGVPAPIDYFSSFGQRYIAALTGIVKQVAKEYQTKTRNEARASWGELADHITVTVSPDLQLNFSIKGEFENLAEAKEYGSIKEAPAAVLRMAAVSANNELSERINALLSKALS